MTKPTRILVAFCRTETDSIPSSAGWLYNTDPEDIIQDWVKLNIEAHNRGAKPYSFDVFINGYQTHMDDTEGFEIEYNLVLPIDYIPARHTQLTECIMNAVEIRTNQAIACLS